MQISLSAPVLLNQPPQGMECFSTRSFQHEPKLVLSDRRQLSNFTLDYSFPLFHDVAKEFDSLIVTYMMDKTFVFKNWDECATRSFVRHLSYLNNNIEEVYQPINLLVSQTTPHLSRYIIGPIVNHKKRVMFDFGLFLGHFVRIANSKSDLLTKLCNTDQACC